MYQNNNFDKSTYSANRKDGKRGQGAIKKAELVESGNPGHLMNIGGRLQRVSRKIFRSRSIDRSATAKNFAYRIRAIGNGFTGHHKKAQAE